MSVFAITKNTSTIAQAMWVNPACFFCVLVIPVHILSVHAAKLWQNTQPIDPQRLRVCAGIFTRLATSKLAIAACMDAAKS